MMLKAAGLALTACSLLALTAPAFADSSSDDAADHAKPPTSAWHIGAMAPVIVRGKGRTMTPPDTLMTMVPFGVLVMRGPLMFDAELMPMVTTGPQAVDLTIAPGFIYALLPDIWIGSRAAFELKSGKVGFTPLFHYNLLNFQHTNLFTELVVPVRFGEDADGRSTSIGFAVALGALFL